ncbi:MAG: hypothetical protein H7A46_01400 [Verrucomicrobiales bacterium]|nr:hypothetical protein [Verrucomicrobiales bacterium]
MRISVFPTVLMFLCCASAIRADEPLAPPSRYEVKSSSHKFVATIDPKSGVRVSAAGSSQALWTSTNWFRVAFLADDGEHLVTGYDGMNLIPQDYTKDLVLISFWRRDKKIRDVTVGELFPDARILQKTVSHYNWGSITTITNGAAVVRRCDGKVMRFDVTTGRITK